MGGWEIAEYVGEGLVAVGVIGEVLAEWRDTKNKLAKIFSVVLIAGLLLSLAALKATNEGFEVRIAELNKEAKQAQERAANADLKRVQLENRILDIFGPRQLTPAQSADIAKHLAGLEGVKIDVYVLALGNPSISKGNSDDPADFARTVVGILRDGAHMDAEGWLASSCFGGSASGFNVSLHLPGSNEDRKTASAVLNAFRPDIATYREVLPTSSGDFCQKFSPLDPSKPSMRKHDAAVSITIGTKVQPILTREMLEPKP